MQLDCTWKIDGYLIPILRDSMKKILAYTICFLLFAPLPLALMSPPSQGFDFWFWMVVGPYILAMGLIGVLLGMCGGPSSSIPINRDSNNLDQIKKYEELNFMRYRGK